MAFIVEDGTNVENANAYVTVEFADSYFEDKGNTFWNSLTRTKTATHCRCYSIH